MWVKLFILWSKYLFMLRTVVDESMKEAGDSGLLPYCKVYYYLYAFKMFLKECFCTAVRKIWSLQKVCLHAQL